MQLLYEDNHLYVINKPVPLATMGALPGVVTALELAKEDLKTRFQKPGNVYLGVVSRLDSLVSGVLVFARTSKSAARLSEQFRTRTVQKLYHVLVEGRPEAATGTLHHWLKRNDTEMRTDIVSAGVAGAQPADLDYRLISRQQGLSLLEIQLHTGRKHQIRAQLAHAGLQIPGDRRYGSRQPFSLGIALHSASLTLQHPVTAQALNFSAPVPDSWPGWAQQQSARTLQTPRPDDTSRARP
jgi:23S rRNA pseudouridine1911/1915/1917 synthase